MKKRTRIILIAAGVMIVLVVILLASMTKSRFNWYETYELESKQPYGTYVLGEMLKNYFPEKKFVVINKSLKETLPQTNYGEKKSYFFIGNNKDYDSLDLNALFSFVANGNTAFISSSYNSYDFMTRLLPDTCAYFDGYGYEYVVDDSVADLNFFPYGNRREKDFSFTYKFRNKPFKYSWNYLDSSFFCGSNNEAVALGYMNKGYYNFVRIPYGHGKFYLHTTPIAFSNYSLTKKENLDYAGRALSYLPQGTIYWDEYNKTPGGLDFNSDLKLSQSPLQYILGQESLRWAWYITLLLLLLYILFFGKRKQRIIPVIEPNTNTSLEFVNTIGELYFQQKEHKVLGRHKMKLFQAFIRNRYFIHSNNPDDETIQKISVKSQIPAEHIKNIFREFSFIDECTTVTKEQLIKFHQLIENFYKNCK
jgi:hypothetical protein